MLNQFNFNYICFVYTKNIMSYYNEIKIQKNVAYCGNIYKDFHYINIMLNEMVENRTNVYIMS